MLSKTLVCGFCGKDRKDTEPECEIAEDHRHKFIKLIDNDKKRIKDILACKVCGKACGGDPHCTMSEDGKHKFDKITEEY